MSLLLRVRSLDSSAGTLLGSHGAAGKRVHLECLVFFQIHCDILGSPGTSAAQAWSFPQAAPLPSSILEGSHEDFSLQPPRTTSFPAGVNQRNSPLSRILLVKTRWWVLPVHREGMIHGPHKVSATAKQQQNKQKQLLTCFMQNFSKPRNLLCTFIISIYLF